MSEYFCKNLLHTTRIGPYDTSKIAQENGILKYGIGNFIIIKIVTPMIDNHLKRKIDLKDEFKIGLKINAKELKALEYIAKIHELESVENVLYESIEKFVDFYKKHTRG